MSYTIRKATLDDQTEIERLIAESVRGLSREDYSERQIELSITSVFGVDTELVLDETYFVAESADGKIVGCGGWSKRKTLYARVVTKEVVIPLNSIRRRTRQKSERFLFIPITQEKESARRFSSGASAKPNLSVLNPPR